MATAAPPTATTFLKMKSESGPSQP